MGTSKQQAALLGFLRQGLALARAALAGNNSPALASQMLGTKACTTTSNESMDKALECSSFLPCRFHYLESKAEV